MDLLQLRYFQAVARREHVSQAAADLMVAQPSLSRSIAALERELGVPLFDRQGRRVRLNRYGSAFLRRVDRALSELSDAERELSDAAGLELGTVAAAAESLRSFAPVLAPFRAAHPGVTFRLFQASEPEMAALLSSGEIDLALTSEPLHGRSITSVVVDTEEVLLAVPPGHRLSGDSSVSLPDIAGEPLVTTRAGYWLRTLTDRLFAEAGLVPVIGCETDEPVVIRDLISAGAGVGLLPSVTRVRSSHPVVSWLRLSAPGCTRTLRLSWRTDTYVSAAAVAFRDALLAQMTRSLSAQ